MDPGENRRLPLEDYPQIGYELSDDHMPLWRFMGMPTFTRLIESRCLYFRRADCFDDEHEGLPLKDYVRGAVRDLGPGHSFEDSWRFLEESRRKSFVSCWTLDESLHMWEKFAPHGVAVRTEYCRLKAALDAIPARTMVGQVRYSLAHERFNVLEFITTKRPEFSYEREVRALLWDMPIGTESLNTSPPEGQSFPVDIPALAMRIVVSPHAGESVSVDVTNLLRTHGLESIPVVKSTLTGFTHLLPTLADIDRYTDG